MDLAPACPGPFLASPLRALPPMMAAPDGVDPGRDNPGSTRAGAQAKHSRACQQAKIGGQTIEAWPRGETRFVSNEVVFQAPSNVLVQAGDAAARRLGLARCALILIDAALSP
jgi:hypothetical protein